MKCARETNQTGGIQIQALLGLAAGILLVAAIAFLGWALIRKPASPAQLKQPAVADIAAVANEPVATKPAEAEIVLGEDMKENGIILHNAGDGPVTPVNKNGVSCVRLRNRPENYIYFSLDQKFKVSKNMNALVWVEFLAPVRGHFDIQYDGYKFGNSNDPFSDSRIGIHFDPSPYWNRVALEMTNARLENRQSDNHADFRLRVICPEFYVRRVTVTNVEETPESAAGPSHGLTER